MSPQTKTLLIGAGALSATRFYFKQPWMMSFVAAGAVMTAFLVLTDFGNTPAPSTTS